MKIFFMLTAVVCLLATFGFQQPEIPASMPNPVVISPQMIQQAIQELNATHGPAAGFRIEKGVRQVAALWQNTDGDGSAFMAFCRSNFVSDPAALQALFEKLQAATEVLTGNFNKMSMDLRLPVDLDGPALTPVDELLGSYSPGAHLTDDLFSNKIAFITALNFPAYSLTEKSEQASKWSRRDWAYARMGDQFTSRVPAAPNQKVAEALAQSDMYISDYNIMMGKLVDNSGKTLFPADMKLITHWGLRDELKSHYGKPEGASRQEMIYQVMKRIIDQSIPQTVINNDKVNWDPYTNSVTENGKTIVAQPENDDRYQFLLNNFKALSATDLYYPVTPNYSQRAFELSMEIPQAEVKQLFVQLLTSPEVKSTAKLIAQKLGRPLRPYDIWFDGFKARSSFNEEALTAKTQVLYPTPAAFEAAMPQLLQKLGWTAERAHYLASKIQVDPARGSGHAAGAYMKGDKARLRTRIAHGGMNYKGYNIAVHEFGHNVEQTIDLYDIDYYMLQGVPNTAFTEALAFLFQKRDLQLLDMADNNPDKEHLAALDAIWSCYEIMGVSLVDMQVWDWMYAHPGATAAELKVAVMDASRQIWNQYYTPIFGSRDETILAIYSHMIDNPLYLSNYPIGHLIDFQIDGFLQGKSFATEVDRMYKLGRLTPQEWMRQAVGNTISVEPMLKAVDEALVAMDKNK